MQKVGLHKSGNRIWRKELNKYSIHFPLQYNIVIVVDTNVWKGRKNIWFVYDILSCTIIYNEQVRPLWEEDCVDRGKLLY